MKIDYISDLHMDFHVKVNGNEIKYKQSTRDFLQTLLPDELGNVLVIAGDISHYNRQSYWILEYFSELYEQVFFVLGNHDYYLISNGQDKAYKHNSMNREMELIGMIFNLRNVTFLHDFSPFEYKGVTFAGATNWYPLTEFVDRNFFNTVSNDSRLIKGYDIGKINYQQTEQYNNMPEVDILVTHVPSIMINSHHKYSSSSCYLNDLKNIKAKYNIMAHCHEQETYEKGDCKFFINAIGYPSEWMQQMDKMDYSKESRANFHKKWNTIKSFNLL